MPDPAFWQGRRVWLTGHTGFKGAWLALWLQSLGAQVHGFSAGPVSEPSLYEVADVADGMAGDVRGDVRSRSELRAAVARARPDVVFHMAAQALVRRGLESPVETFTVNAGGTAKVLEAVRAEAEPRAVVVVTSDKCYRNDGGGIPFREDDALGGEDPYSASKAAQEHVAAAFRALGLPLATVRAGNAIGGGDWAPGRLVPDCMRAALAGEPVAIRAPDSVRPWQHVLCPLDGYLTVAERLCDGEPGAAWNFGPAEEDARPVAWLVERMRERWPGALHVRAAAPDAARGESPALRLDSSRARERLGWAPRWDLAAAVDATVAWYVAHREGAGMRAETLRQIAAYGQANRPPRFSPGSAG
jgi:CDP-glucose 4,6-dehydratase